MSYTYHGTTNLITLPGREVQTFPSGLVRITRTYACRKDFAGAFRQQFAVGNLLPLDEGLPAIDNAYIFPEPIETTDDDGFTKFRVSAYGRTNTTGTYTPITRAEPVLQEGSSNTDRYYARRAEDYLLQTLCVIRPSALEKAEINRPAQPTLIGSGIYDGNDFYVYLNWVVIDKDAESYGAIEETKITWAQFRQRVYWFETAAFFRDAYAPALI